MATQSTTNKPAFLKNMKRSIKWFGLTLFSGLSQIWIIGIIGLLSSNAFFSVTIEEIFFGGGLLFFSIALTTSLAIDYFIFEESSRFHNSYLVFAFILFSFCLIIYFMCYFQTKLEEIEIIEIEVAAIAQLFILFLTAIYAILIKQESLKRCEKSGE